MPSSPGNPFEVLGVPLEADDRIVRKQYALKLREARASGDAQSMQTVQSAFEAISDEDARRRQIDRLQSSGNVEPLLAAATEAAMAGDLNQANARFRQIFQEAPESEVALSAYLDYQIWREKYSQAYRACRKLTALAPNNADYWRQTAWVLFLNAMSDHSDIEAKLQLALKSVRKAAELGDPSAERDIVEARILWSQDRRQLATKLLRRRLEAAGEIRTAELEVALELLRLHKTTGGFAFRQTLDKIAVMLPTSEERCETIGYALCGMAAELEGNYPARAIECVELAEICCPSDPTVEQFSHELKGSQGELADEVESELIGGARLPKPDLAPSWWFPWCNWIFIIIAIKFCFFALRECSRQRPAKLHIIDENGKVIDTIDSDDSEALQQLIEQFDEPDVGER